MIEYKEDTSSKEDLVVGKNEAVPVRNEKLELITKEQKEARERFSDLIEIVSKRYESLSEAMREDFIVHNGEILDSVIELGIENGFSLEEMQKLEMAAILHDMAKADQPNEEFKNIPNYVLATHAEQAALEVPNLLTDEYLEKQGYVENFDAVRLEIQNAIRQHMGPHPGFMAGILSGVNAKLREMGKEEIQHPQAQGKISEALLAADMRSLAGTKGRKKILSIRANVDFFKNQDRATAEDYKKHGIDLSVGEAALLSGFESADQARDMIQNEKYRNWVDGAIEVSKNEPYGYPGNPSEGVMWQVASQKKQQYEDAKKIEALRNNLNMKKAA